MAKAAAIFVIALVFVAAVLLRQTSAPAPLPARTIAVHAVALPGAVMRSESTPNPFRTHSEPVRSGFRVGSEYEHGSSRAAGANAFTELRTSMPAAELLAARPMQATADPAPGISSAPPNLQRTGHVTRAFETAAQQTSGAVRTAGRALRSVF